MSIVNDKPTPETDASRGYALSSHYGRLEGSYLQMDRRGPFVHAEVARKLEHERDEAINAIRETLEENRHLSDGDDCTLRKLKAIVPDWK